MAKNLLGKYVWHRKDMEGKIKRMWNKYNDKHICETLQQ